MKIVTRKKCRTVSAKSAAEFDEEFNRVSESLPRSAELVWDGEMMVHFIYEEDEKIAETVADEYELQGLCYKCENCPYLEMDEDRRRRRHTCKYSEYGVTFDDSPACEVFYKALRAGKIEPLERRR